MAYPENVVLCMLEDQDTATRAEAVQMVRHMRDRRGAGPVRRFRKPTIKFEAEHYLH